MSVSARTLALVAALALWGASQAEAQGVVVWAGGPAVVAYPPPLFPLPPPPLAYYPPPRVAYYYAPPAVAVYSAPPPVAYYEVPMVYAGPVMVRTRYGLLGRPRATIFYYP